nr:immunoglobulin heavy chain junction region [Macaca mulatta]
CVGSLMVVAMVDHW